MTVSGTLSDVTFNVTASVGTAIQLTATGRLERVRINANNLATNGVAGPGAVKDVYVSRAVDAGFRGIRRFEGATYSEFATKNFQVTGDGPSSAPDALMLSYGCDWLGFYLGPMTNGDFDGALASQRCGEESGAQNATGIETWEPTSNSSFNIMISGSDPGYGLAIYGTGTFGNTVNEFWGDQRGSPVDGDPGISMGAGAHNNTINKATALYFSVGLVFGEDVSPSPHHNVVHTFRSERTSYGGVFMDRGAYNNIVGDIGGTTLIDAGGPDSNHRGSVYISNRVCPVNGDGGSLGCPYQGNITPPHDNQVLGLNQVGTFHVPIYAVYIGPGTARNTVTGGASSWRIAKYLDEGLSGSIVKLN